MKTKLTNEKVFDLAYYLKSSYPELTKFDKRFNFAVTRTLATIQPIAADLLKARESNIERYNEFETKKKDIIQKYSSDGINFVSDEEKQKCQNEVIELSKGYTDAFEERKKEVEIFNEILSQEVEVDIIQCSFDVLPQDYNFDLGRLLIKETDAEIEAKL